MKKILRSLELVFPKMENKEAYVKLLLIVIDGLTIQEAINKSNYEYEDLEKLLLQFGESL